LTDDIVGPVEPSYQAIFYAAATPDDPLNPPQLSTSTPQHEEPTSCLRLDIMGHDSAPDPGVVITEKAKKRKARAPAKRAGKKIKLSTPQHEESTSCLRLDVMGHGRAPDPGVVITKKATKRKARAPAKKAGKKIKNSDTTVPEPADSRTTSTEGGQSNADAGPSVLRAVVSPDGSKRFPCPDPTVRRFVGPKET
jgi:hypothetical protein